MRRSAKKESFRKQALRLAAEFQNVFQYAGMQAKGSAVMDKLAAYYKAASAHLAALEKEYPKRFRGTALGELQEKNRTVTIADIPALIEYANCVYHALFKALGRELSEEEFIILTADQPAGTHRPGMEKKTPVYIVLDNIRSPFNVGSIFRTAEGMQAAAVYLCGFTPSPSHKKVRRAAMGTDTVVQWKSYKYTEACISALKKKGAAIVGVETKKKSVAYNECNPVFPVALVFGNEEFGLSYKVLSLCDSYVHIPMSGFKNSLNVANAAAVILFHMRLKNAHLKLSSKKKTDK